MNLIEKLGLEKCKQIVDAPSWASHYIPSTGKTICCHNENHFYFRDQERLGVEHIRLSDIRAALADHDSKLCLHGYDIACLICGFGTENGMRVWRKQIETDNVADIRNHISPNTKVIEHE